MRKCRGIMKHFIVCLLRRHCESFLWLDSWDTATSTRIKVFKFISPRSPPSYCDICNKRLKYQRHLIASTKRFHLGGYSLYTI